MNILFVHEVDWLEKVVFDIHFLAESLSLRGHQVYAIDYEDRWRKRNFFDLGTLKTREFEVVDRAFPGAAVHLRRPGAIKIPGLSRLSAFCTHSWEVGRTIREKNIDAIILYSVPTNGLPAILAARRRRIPVLFRSIDILHILVPYSTLRPVTRFLERLVYTLADLVLPNTPQYLRYVRDAGVPESRVRYLPFPVDTERFQPAPEDPELRRQWGIAEDEAVIVFIGTLFPFSGLDGFIREFPGVLRAAPATRLLIVGDGPQRAGLERIIRELGLKDRVIITGFQPYQTMPGYLNLATICINPFLMTEKTMDVFPAKVVQYAACGKPSVATALRGIISVLPGEEQGVVYVKDAAEMAAAVIALLKSPERRERLGKAGRAYVEATYGYQKIAADLETILQESIKEKQHDAKATSD
ncbi:MAG: glycosyltransferase family 4 protein [Chloroflexota bacterium]